MRGKIKVAKKDRKASSTKKSKQAKTYVKESKMTCGWTPSELIVILTKIIKKNPNITYLEVRKHEIQWNCEYSKTDFIPVKKTELPGNPSRRKKDETIKSR